METFDVRCALTGVVIRSEPVVLLPLICAKGGVGRMIGLPRKGRPDGAGGLAGTRACPVFDAFARSMVRRASFPGSTPEPQQLLARLSDLVEEPAKLGMRQLGVGYALQSVYDALVMAGRGDATVSEKLRGKKRDAASLFGIALFEGKTCQILHELVPEEAHKKLRIALVALARTGLGHRDLPRATTADRVRYAPPEREAALTRARREWSSIPEVAAALERHAAGQV